jgi:hypothetical protein
VQRRHKDGFGLEKECAAQAMRTALQIQPQGESVALPRRAVELLADFLEGKVKGKRGRHASFMDESRREIMKLDRQSGKSVAALAAETGVSAETIRDWTESDGKRMDKKRHRSRKPA